MLQGVVHRTIRNWRREISRLAGGMIGFSFPAVALAQTLDSASFGPAGQGPSDRAAISQKVREIRSLSLPPAEMISKIYLLIKEDSERRLSSQQVVERTRSTAPVRYQPLSEDEALRLDVANELQTIREKLADDPRTQVALIGEFLRLNRETLTSLRQQTCDEVEKSAIEQARKEQLQSRVAGNPSDLFAQAALVLEEAREQVGTPRESVALTAEFIRLNRETLEAEKEMLGAKVTNPR